MPEPTAEDGPRRFRLLTRCDFDGLVSAALLKQVDLIDEICYVHPKAMQDGEIKVTDRDISTNLPYVEGIHLAFDHHSSEVVRVGDDNLDHFIDDEARSAARVVYDHFGGAEAFENFPIEIIEAVDKCDDAQFTIDEVLNPTGWVLFNFLLDPRTALSRHEGFRISNEQLMLDLADWIRRHTLDELLALPDVKERVDLYRAHTEPFREQMKRCAQVHKDLVVIDLRKEEKLFCGNRFVIYALFPEQRISMHVVWGKARKNTVFAVGKSTVNRGAPVNIGMLMLSYGGGGHKNVGTCQIDHAAADQVKAELVARLAGSV